MRCARGHYCRDITTECHMLHTVDGREKPYYVSSGVKCKTSCKKWAPVLKPHYVQFLVIFLNLIEWYIFSQSFCLCVSCNSFLLHNEVLHLTSEITYEFFSRLATQLFVLLCLLYKDEFDTYEVLSLAFFTTYEVLSLAFFTTYEVLHLTSELTYEVFPAQWRYMYVR